jgi:hypothetical protein
MALGYSFDERTVGGCVNNDSDELTLKKERNPDKFLLVSNLLWA